MEKKQEQVDAIVAKARKRTVQLSIEEIAELTTNKELYEAFKIAVKNNPGIKGTMAMAVAHAMTAQFDVFTEK